MPTLRRATCREILLAIHERIFASCKIPRERIVITAADAEDVEHVNAEQDVLLRAMGESPEAGIEGGGRYVNRRKRTLEVVLRTRLWVDEAHTDTKRLTDASLGHWALEDLVVDALEHWFPLDSAGDALSEPVECKGISMPRKDRKDKGWISSRLDASFVYLRDLTLAERA